nr:MAG TPA: hypothetical protein [Caudoviricetes sp.]DAT64737.1 MAG TPA: hypothetical protein [Caudoviricetes sp.]
MNLHISSPPLPIYIDLVMRAYGKDIYDISHNDSHPFIFSSL